MDVVYILGTRSRWQNNEIRYSIRSLLKHVTGFKNIYIVGEWPYFLSQSAIRDSQSEIFHIPAEDYKPKDATWYERNIMSKILVACNDPRVSDDFFFMNDDFFFLQDFDCREFPYYYSGTIQEMIATRKPHESYLRSLQNTLTALNGIHGGPHFFDIHRPIIYNKEKFKSLAERFDWKQPFGLVAKSLYCNTLVEFSTKAEDLKLIRPMLAKPLRELLKDKLMFSIADRALNIHLRNLMNELYPSPSEWEIK